MWLDTPHKIIILLTIYPALYMTSLWLIYFISGNLYFSIPFTYSIHPPPFTPPHPTSRPQQPVVGFLYLWVYFFIFVFCFLGSTYKGKHTVFVFLCLTYFTMHDTHQVHQHCQNWQDFTLLWLSNIPLYILMTFFIQLSISRHLGYINTLVIVNNLHVLQIHAAWTAAWTLRCLFMSFLIRVFIFFG